LSDVNQRIFRLSTWKKDGGINVVGRTHHLSVNYRTTKQINDYARYQFVNSEMITSHIKEYKSIFNGVEPLIESFQSESAQYKYIVTKVNELSENNYTAEQICVICSTVDECKQVHSILTFSDVKSTILIGDVIPGTDTGICICPINGVKGLEFEAVVLFNYNNIGKSMLNDSQTAAVKINYEKLIECEKYVAATRARNELIITYLEDANI
jgi:DNA helicase IV